MKHLLFFILLVAFGCQRTTVSGQQTLCTVPESVEGTASGASTSSATAYPTTVDGYPMPVDYYENQIRLADSLYKNYLPQYNFDEVKAAMEFFDSLRLSKTTDNSQRTTDFVHWWTTDNGQQTTDIFHRSKTKSCTSDAYSRTVDCCPLSVDFICAKAHYYHAVGLTEKDDIVGACEHYLIALEIMEEDDLIKRHKDAKTQRRKVLKKQRSDEKTLCDSVTLRLCDSNKEDYEKIRFVALIYTRLGRLFYDENYCDLAMLKYKKALQYYNIIDDTISISYTYKNIGNVYQLLDKTDSALYHYRKSLEIYSGLTNKLDIEKSIAQILFDKGEKDSAYIMIKSNLEKLDNYRTIDSYYGILGIFYHEDEEYDSAIYYLGKCSESTNNYVRNASSIRLSAIYDSLGDLEKKAYYDNISSKLLIEKNNKETEHNKIQSVYNGYKERKQERINLANKKKITILLIFTFIAISIAILSIWYFSQKKNNILLGQIRTNKENYLKELERVGKYNIKIIKQKEEEINKSKKEISKMRSKIEQNGAINLEAYYDSDICKKIIERKDTDFSSLKEDELALMLKYADKHLNNISGRLMKKFPSLNKNDVYTICLIILNIEKNKLPHLLNRDRKTIWDRLNKIKKLMGLEDKQDLFIHIKDNFLN